MDMTNITAIHENGSEITISRAPSEVMRTIRLMKQSGYRTFRLDGPDGPLPLIPSNRHTDCDCMSCLPWTY
jgi:hypothetical protein